MKLVVASDIHGSGYYCKKLMDAVDAECADSLLLLGDILYHGPRNDLPQEYGPKMVISLLNQRKDIVMCVRGNCDAEVDQMVLDFPIMAEYCMIEEDGLTMFATHGHHYNESHLPPLGHIDVLLNGHTHVPKCVSHGNYYYMNPGSVSLPKEGSHHGYIVYEDRTFTWKDLERNVIHTCTIEVKNT